MQRYLTAHGSARASWMPDGAPAREARRSSDRHPALLGHDSGEFSANKKDLAPGNKTDHLLVTAGSALQNYPHGTSENSNGRLGPIFDCAKTDDFFRPYSNDMFDTKHSVSKCIVRRTPKVDWHENTKSQRTFILPRRHSALFELQSHDFLKSNLQQFDNTSP